MARCHVVCLTITGYDFLDRTFFNPTVWHAQDPPWHPRSWPLRPSPEDDMATSSDADRHTLPAAVTEWYEELDAMAPPGFLLKVVTVQLDDVRLRLLRATDGAELLCCTLGGVAVPLPSPEPNPNP